ncbi:hypothetical protein M8C21_002350, partial [Ambrosia artemisiifolia]
VQGSAVPNTSRSDGVSLWWCRRPVILEVGSRSGGRVMVRCVWVEFGVLGSDLIDSGSVQVKSALGRSDLLI